MSTSNPEYFQTGGHAMAAAIVLFMLDITAVGLRFYTRQQQKLRPRAEDWLMLPALIFTVGIGIIIIYGVVRESLGHPLKLPEGFAGNPLSLDSEQIRTMMTLQVVYSIILPLALGFAKCSFICLFIRLFSTKNRSGINIMLTGTLGFIIVWMVTFFLAAVFQCGTNFWAFGGSAMDLITQCPHTSTLDVAVCASDFATDVIIICMPIPLMPRGKKIAVSAIFLLGGVTVIASLVRLIIQVKMYTVGFDPDEDGVLIVTGYLYWGMVECGIAVVAACVPVLQSLFRTGTWRSLATKLSGKSSSSSAANYADEKNIGVSSNNTATSSSSGSEKI